jgi:hypothetical protein
LIGSWTSARRCSLLGSIEAHNRSHAANLVSGMPETSED